MRDNYLEPKIKRKMIARKKNYFEVNKTTSGSSKKAENSEKGVTTKTRNKKNHGHGTHIRLEESVIAQLEVPLADLERPPGNVSGPLHPKRKSWNVTFTVTAVQICKANNFLITRVTKTYVKTKDKK